jgi:hypothetical protein
VGEVLVWDGVENGSSYIMTAKLKITGTVYDTSQFAQPRSLFLRIQKKYANVSNYLVLEGPNKGATGSVTGNFGASADILMKSIPANTQVDIDVEVLVQCSVSYSADPTLIDFGVGFYRGEYVFNTAVAWNLTTTWYRGILSSGPPLLPLLGVG